LVQFLEPRQLLQARFPDLPDLIGKFRDRTPLTSRSAVSMPMIVSLALIDRSASPPLEPDTCGFGGAASINGDCLIFFMPLSRARDEKYGAARFRYIEAS
jgi:hypothetical protein